MERGVEHGNLRRAGHDRLAGQNALQVGGVVERAQGEAVANGLLARVVHDAAGGELVAAVQHAVADRADFLHVRDYAVILVHQRFQNQLDGGGVILEAGVHDELLFAVPAVFMGELAGIHADALGQTLGDDQLSVHVDQLILEGRGTGVDDENFHASFSFVTAPERR